jgi:hypothetical protein
LNSFFILCELFTFFFQYIQKSCSTLTLNISSILVLHRVSSSSRLRLRSLQVLQAQELLDELVRGSGVVGEIDAVTSVWLDIRGEIACFNVRNVHADHRGKGRCDTTSGSAVAATIWEIGIY